MRRGEPDEAVHAAGVASRVSYSPYHFHRLFHAVAGETLGAYARKRRHAEAARELAATHRRVSGIALDYQFQSQEGFTRAFVRMFGVTPTRYRKRPTAIALHSGQRITRDELLHLKEGISVTPKLVHKDTPGVVGLI